MLNRLDWKFFLTLIVTIASVAVPVWLWQLDLSSKALTLIVKSTAELQPQGVDALEGVQLLVDGKPLNSPYVSVLELSNTGSKPIVTSDFEGPIRISSTAPSQVVKFRPTSSTPPALEPVLSISDSTVLLQPLLLNPGDVIRFITVTANGRPAYAVRGRVAGVSEVAISDAAGRETKSNWLGRAVSTLLMVIYILNLSEFAHAGIRRRTFLPWSLATGLVAAFGAALILVIQFPGDTSPATNLLPAMAVAALVALPMFILRLKKRSAA